MSKFVWVIERNFAGLWEPYAVFTSRHDAAREVKSCILETRIVKYIPAPVAPKAPKPAPKPVAVLTDWIPCETPPVRVGVYRRRLLEGTIGFQAWHGSYWDIFRDAEEYTEPGALQLAQCDLTGLPFASIMDDGHYQGFVTPQE